jgi:hypothetical protein
MDVVVVGRWVVVVVRVCVCVSHAAQFSFGFGLVSPMTKNCQLKLTFL